MATPTIPAGQSPDQDPREIKQRWLSLEERCIALSGKTFPDLDREELMRVVNLFSADDRSFALNHLQQFCNSNEAQPAGAGPVVAPKQQRRRKRQPPEERMTLAEAFAYDGDENYARDTVKGVLAVSFLLDSISKSGNDAVDARIAQGLAYALREIAGDAGHYLTEKYRLNAVESALERARTEAGQ